MAEHYLVPPSKDTEATDISYSLLAEMIEEAEDLFVDAKDRLLDVTGWATFSSLDDIHFRLADSAGHEVKRQARRGDHILISDKEHTDDAAFDWFTIDALEYDDYPDDNLETFAIRMHPSGPTAGTDTSKNTATIVIERNGSKLSAMYHGRQFATGTRATWHVLTDHQWASLMQGLIEYFG